LKVDVSPETIKALADNTIEITVTVDAGGDMRTNAGELAMAAGRGSISATERTGPGKYRAVLTVPPMPPPRTPAYLPVLAVFTTGEDIIAGHRVMPVYSQLNISGRASPGSVLQASAGTAKLGKPFTSGPDGKYDMSIPIPPGIGSISITVSKGGQEKTSTIDLDFRSRRQAAVAVHPEALRAGIDRGTVAVFAIDERGRPETGAGVGIECRPGKCSKTVSPAPGIFFAEYAPPADTPEDNARVLVSYGNRTYSSAFDILRQFPVKVLLSAAEQDIMPGEAADLTATVFGPGGEPLDGAEVTVYLNENPAGKASARGHGEYFFSKSFGAGDNPVIAKAVAVHPALPSQSVSSEELVIGISRYYIRLSAFTSSKDAGPGDEIKIETMAVDPRGTGIEGLDLEVKPEAGRIVDSGERGDGIYYFNYVAPEQWNEPRIKLEYSAPDNGMVRKIYSYLNWTGAGGTPEAGERDTYIDLAASKNRAVPGDTILLTATLRDRNGAGVEGRTVDFTSSTGELSRTFETGGGVYSARLDIPPDAGAGTVSVTATAGDGPGGGSASVEIELAAAGPASVAIETEAGEVYVSSRTVVPVSVSVKEIRGGGLPGRSVILRKEDAGKVETFSLTTGLEGVAQKMVELEPRAGTAVFTAFLAEDPSISDTASITKITYLPAYVELEADSGSVPADGETVVTITAVARNKTGTPATGEPIEFAIEAGSGSLAERGCVTGQDGRCSVTFVPGVSCGTARIEAYPSRNETVRRTITIEETAAITTTLELSVVPETLAADGFDCAELTVTARDAGGCIVAGETLGVETSGGFITLSSRTMETDLEGRAAVSLIAGRESGTETVTVRPASNPLVAAGTEVPVLAAGGPAGDHD